MDTKIPDLVMDEILKLVQQQHKIAAVKLYKDHTQSSLAEAKAAIDALESNMAQAHQFATTTELIGEDIEGLIYNRQKLEAVKLYKERYNVSLMDAKIAVERLMAKLESEHPERFTKQKSAGCISVVLISVCVVTLCWLGL